MLRKVISDRIIVRKLKYNFNLTIHVQIAFATPLPAMSARYLASGCFYSQYFNFIY